MSGDSRVAVRSGLDILRTRALAAQEAAEDLVARSEVRRDDINARGDIFFVGWNVWQWGPLSDEAQPLVGAARVAHDELITFARLAFEVGAPDRLQEVDDLSRWLLRLVEQPNGSLPNGAPASSAQEIAARIRPRIDDFLAEAGRLLTAHGPEARLLVADTSALLDHPSMQDWRLDGEHWTVVLVPQVLAELDERKRDQRTVEAAQKVIRQIEEFSRRGNTFAGVPLAGAVSFREVPHSPDMSRSLPWLRADTPDDQIIASALELVARDLRSRVAVLASDRNVRNKARLAGISTVTTAQL